MNRKIMNDIMYYLRKLLKLARKAQTMSLKEGIDLYEDKEFQKELYEIREFINSFEK